MTGQCRIGQLNYKEKLADEILSTLQARKQHVPEIINLRPAVFQLFTKAKKIKNRITPYHAEDPISRYFEHFFTTNLPEVEVVYGLQTAKTQLVPYIPPLTFFPKSNFGP